MDINTLRTEMDRLNNELLLLFVERMKVAQAIGRYKAARNLPVYDPQREAQIIEQMRARAPEELRPYVGPFFQSMMDLAKQAEHEIE